MSESQGVDRVGIPAPSVRRRHLGPWLWGAALLAAVGLGVVLGRWAFEPPPVAAGSSTPATVAVAQMTVGTSVPLAVSARWTVRPLGVGAASGVLTSIDVADGAAVQPGGRLYTVDLRPVVAAVGDIPAFRDLAQGARGADVTQLQRLLADGGFLGGHRDGVVDRATVAAVKAWQASLGVEQDGVVRAGDLLFAARLPARVELAQDVAVGKRLVPGDVVLSVLDGDPEFVATIPQAQDVDPTLPIEVTVEGEVVPAVVAGSRDDQSGNTLWSLTRADGSALCAARCDEVPLDPQQAVFPARQIVVPEVTGPGVPAAAVWFTADGEPYLVGTDGARLPVRILGRGQGAVVFEGVEPGTVVLLADEGASGSATPGASSGPASPTATP